jgi:GxxExxY protein
VSYLKFTEIGKGFSEIVYKDAIEYEFQEQSINMKEKRVFCQLQNTTVKHKFYADFVVYDKIIQK